MYKVITESAQMDDGHGNGHGNGHAAIGDGHGNGHADGGHQPAQVSAGDGADTETGGSHADPDADEPGH